MPRDVTPIVRFIKAPEPEMLASGFSVEERVVLDEINRRVAAEDSIESIIDFLFETTRDVFPCDRIGLAFVEEGGQRVVSQYAVASYEPLLLSKGYAEDVAGSTLRKVIEVGEPRIIGDLSAYLDRKPESRSTRILVKEGVLSSMTCPLSVKGRNVGLLFRSSRQKDAYDEHQALMHMAIAERLSQAVEKAWRIEQLSESNRAYFEMLGFVSHEIKSPLSAIVMNAELLTANMLGELNPEQRDMVERIVRKAQYLLSLVREYLDLSRLEGGDLKLGIQKDVGIRSNLVDPALDMLEPQIQDRKSVIEVDVPEDLKADCDPDLLMVVLVNLVGNAVKYGNEGGKVRILAGLDGGSIRVAVWNEGPGFSDEQKTMLFKKFSRIEDSELLKRKGTGLGLYTTWRLINMHGGKIQAESEKGKWAEFSFRIPQHQPPAL
jgi:hypothetical protein